MFAVVVEITLHPGTRADFLSLVQKNAAASMQNEPGCHQFDVAADAARPDEILLYEIYSDADAFDTHLASEHFARFDNAVSEMISRKVIKTYRQVFQ